MLKDFDIKIYLGDIKLKSINNKSHIWDLIRRKWLVLQPEELVRQLFIIYLQKTHQYPIGKIAIEKKISGNKLFQRYDLQVFDHNMLPFMLIECKSFDNVITEENIHQVIRYNASIGAPYICITNGTNLLCYKKVELEYSLLSSFPIFPTK